MLARRYRAVLRALGDRAPHRVAIALSCREGEEAHRLSRFDLALQATREGIWEWVVDGGAVWWNARCNEIFGYDLDREPTFEAWTERIHPEDRDHVLSGYLATVDSSRDRWRTSTVSFDSTAPFAPYWIVGRWSATRTARRFASGAR